MQDIKAEQKNIQEQYQVHLESLKNKGFYDKEIAVWMGLTVDQADLVRKMRNGDSTIFDFRMVALSRKLIEKHNDFSIASELFPRNWMTFGIPSGNTNGSIKDELLNIGLFCGKIIEETQNEKMDASKIIEFSKKIASEAATLEQEVKSE